MRRTEFEVSDRQALETTLAECEYGVLSLVSAGEPYGVAVNFAYRDGALYFHSGREGRKVEAIGTRARASFLAVKPYAFIPSHFSGERWACPATQMFASVHVDGDVFRLSDPAEQALGLTALMEKMQPEGGYEPITPESPLYAKILKKTVVYRIVPRTMSLKVKAGQNQNDARRRRVVGKLRERGAGLDLQTAELMMALAEGDAAP